MLAAEDLVNTAERVGVAALTFGSALAVMYLLWHVQGWYTSRIEERLEECDRRNDHLTGVVIDLLGLVARLSRGEPVPQPEIDELVTKALTPDPIE